jgi:hypothetical protein
MVETNAGATVLDVRSTGPGVATLHGMFRPALTSSGRADGPASAESGRPRPAAGRPSAARCVRRPGRSPG